MRPNNLPIITVITVVYNKVQEIETTIRSVIAQNYPSIDYIIIDGGSTDGTIEIIKRYNDCISLWISEPDKGIYDAMNKGIIHAKGEWINFMNAGDCYKSNNILTQLSSYLTANIDILRGNIIRVYPHFKVKSVGVTVQNPGLIDLFNNTFHHQATLIRISLFKKYGLYSLDYKLCSDWKFFFDCIVLHHINSKYVDITVALFKMDGASTNHSILYTKEQEKYLKTLYGEELFNLLQELNIYRKLKLIKLYYKFRLFLTNHLSQKNFNKILTLKRFMKRLLGMNVN